MITTRLMGGMGNQMFQFACGLTQARRLGVKLDLDVTLLGGKRKYVLDQWNLPADITLVTGTPTTVSEHGMAYNRDINERVKDQDCLEGYWQSKKYFEPIEDEIRKIFVPRQPVKGFHSDVMDTAAVHIRRDDYLRSPHKEFHGLLPMSYYQSAMQHIRERTVCPAFYIFSEDVEWSRKNFTSWDEHVVEPSSEAADIYKMSLCQHSITANSSFSWWAAFLGDDQPDRIVIAPSQWFQDQRTDYSDIVPDRWLRH